MTIVYFTHSLRSDWNHGNAHFVRGFLSEMQARGHHVRAFEPRQSWSAQNLLKDAGPAALEEYLAHYPGLECHLYDPDTLDFEAELENAALVLVHEWNEPSLVAAVGRARAHGGFKLLFHDTHHRAATAPHEMEAFDLDHYDGVLAFGNVIRDLYLRNRWAERAWTWHEAADTRVFRPTRPAESDRHEAGCDLVSAQLVWVGNWGDGERTKELYEFLVHPAAHENLSGDVYGVRYPDSARSVLDNVKLRYGGYLPNFGVPEVFAKHRVTIHIPRRPYVEMLPGIPTIRPFEAMACGIPLICAPWHDSEQLFRPGQDYLIARNGEEMAGQLRSVLNEPARAAQLLASGLETILARHTCSHRVDELLGIYEELN